MTDGEVSSDIDRIFADGTLIDEALKQAARLAIERHRRAGEPLVVYRDGQIRRVAAEELDEDDGGARVTGEEPLLIETELGLPRTARELGLWVEDRCRAIADCPAAKRAAFLQEALFKKFYEEMYPLSLFVRQLYDQRRDVVCSLHPENTDHDAVIQDFSATPPATTYVEFTTTAFNRTEHLRMKFFLEHGRVSVFAQASEGGRGRIEVEDEAVPHDELLRRACGAIEEAARKKSIDRHGPGRYGPQHVLVVTFDDWLWFGTAVDIATLESFARQRLVSWRLNFAVLYVLGLSGNTLLRFDVPPR